MAVSQEKIVLLIAIVLFCVFSFFLKGFLSSGNLIALVRSVSTLGILGVGMALARDRARDRSDDRRDLRDVGRLDAPPRQWRRLDPARHAAGLSVCVGGGRDQRRADRLCRDPRSLRDSGHGLAGLWLRALRPRAALRRLHARQRLRHRLDRRRIRLGRADANPVFRACRPARFLVPALHQAGAVHLCDRRQFRGGAYFGRAGASGHRPAICACPRRSPTSPA